MSLGIMLVGVLVGIIGFLAELGGYEAIGRVLFYVGFGVCVVGAGTIYLKPAEPGTPRATLILHRLSFVGFAVGAIAVVVINVSGPSDLAMSIVRAGAILFVVGAVAPIFFPQERRKR